MKPSGWKRAVLFPAIGCSMMSHAQLDLSAMPEPLGVKIPHERTMHGETFHDPYFWYRQKENPDLLRRLRDENQYSDAVMKPTAALQDKLYKELVGRIKEDDQDVPVWDAGYWYYTKTSKGKQYATFCRKKGTLKGKEEVLLDVNAIAKDKPYVGIGAFTVSPNGKLLAYSVDSNGHRDYELFIKNLETGKLLPDKFGVVASVEWAQDNATLYYSTENEAKRTDTIWRRKLGSKSPTQLFTEPEEAYDVGIDSSRDRSTLFVVTESKDTNETWILDLAKPNASLRLFAKRTNGVRYYIEKHRDRYYIRTNDKARTFRALYTPIDKMEKGNWKVFVGARKDSQIDGIDFFGDQCILTVVNEAGIKLEAVSLKGGATKPIKLADGNYVASVSDNRDPEAATIRVSVTSLTRPREILDMDTHSFQTTLVKRQPVIGYDPSQYVSELIWATARDGVKVPISLAYKKGTPKTATTPLYLYAYGAYGSSSFPSFRSSWVSMMDAGMIVAIAHIRGGGELGDDWYYSGKLANKINTFHDFIDCADDLVERNYTSHDRMAISGGSAGGLTMGAVLNMRPDVCKCALVYVPFVDVINTMSDETIPLTTQEFTEWGNPKVAAQYKWIREYSPYDNIAAQKYPAILTRTSLNDSQVPYWEPAKWVSRLRDFRTNKEPLLLKINMGAGHGGASGRYDALKDVAYDYAFMFTVLGIKR